MLTILSKIFQFFVDKRNNWYAKHSHNANIVLKSEYPVISVGNLSVGGTGKTPTVIELCKILKELGYFPSVIGRGYKRKSKSNVVVSDGKEIFVDAKIGGDEMILLAENAKVPVIAGNSKSKIAKSIKNFSKENNFQIDCLVIDDGFQHRKLHRDLDIVLIDSATLENPFLLPKGRLREPLNSLSRADIILLTKGAKKEKFIQKYEYLVKEKLVLEVETDLAEYYLLYSKNIDSKSKNINKIMTVTGIANPQNFIDMLKNKNYDIINSEIYADHHNFTTNGIKLLSAKCRKYNCSNIAITEKDAVKLKEFQYLFDANEINVLVFKLDIFIKDKEKLVSLLIEKIKNLK